MANYVEIRKTGDGRFAVHEKIRMGPYSNDAYEPVQYIGDPQSSSAAAALARREAYFEGAYARRDVAR